MNISIIDNLNTNNNHASRLKELFTTCDSVIIISPFLMEDLSEFLCDVDLRNQKEIHLITTLQPNSFDQIRKVNSFISLIELPEIKNHQINCKISINNKLHGKIYIFKKNEAILSAIMSSANFTGRGLSHSHEWGVEISDQTTIEDLENKILSTIQIQNITAEEVYKLQEAADKFIQEQPQAEQREVDLNLSDLLIKKEEVHLLANDNVTYWLKPIGVTEDPVLPDKKFSEESDDLYFSKRRPTGVRPNDILITYGVGSTKILSIYRATSFADHVTPDDIEENSWMERWPWYVTGLNLTRRYGHVWSQYDLSLNNLKNDFLNENPEGYITFVGGKTLGTIQRGADRVRLSHEFATFIISKVMSINEI